MLVFRRVPTSTPLSTAKTHLPPLSLLKNLLVGLLFGPCGGHAKNVSPTWWQIFTTDSWLLLGCYFLDFFWGAQVKTQKWISTTAPWSCFEKHALKGSPKRQGLSWNIYNTSISYLSLLFASICWDMEISNDFWCGPLPSIGDFHSITLKNSVQTLPNYSGPFCWLSALTKPRLRDLLEAQTKIRQDHNKPQFTILAPHFRLQSWGSFFWRFLKNVMKGHQWFGMLLRKKQKPLVRGTEVLVCVAHSWSLQVFAHVPFVGGFFLWQGWDRSCDSDDGNLWDEMKVEFKNIPFIGGWTTHLKNMREGSLQDSLHVCFQHR